MALAVVVLGPLAAFLPGPAGRIAATLLLFILIFGISNGARIMARERRDAQDRAASTEGDGSR